MQELQNTWKRKIKEILFSESSHIDNRDTIESRKPPPHSLFSHASYVKFPHFFLLDVFNSIVDIDKFLPWTVLHHAQLYWLLKVQEPSGVI